MLSNTPLKTTCVKKLPWLDISSVEISQYNNDCLWFMSFDIIRSLVQFFKIKFSMPYGRGSQKRAKLQIVAESVKPIWFYGQLCILALPIPYCVKLIMVTKLDTFWYPKWNITKPWNFPWVMRKIWEIFWYQNLKNFGKSWSNRNMLL